MHQLLLLLLSQSGTPLLSFHFIIDDDGRLQGVDRKTEMTGSDHVHDASLLRVHHADPPVQTITNINTTL